MYSLTGGGGIVWWPSKWPLCLFVWILLICDIFLLQEPLWKRPNCYPVSELICSVPSLAGADIGLPVMWRYGSLFVPFQHSLPLVRMYISPYSFQESVWTVANTNISLKRLQPFMSLCNQFCTNVSFHSFKLSGGLFSPGIQCSKCSSNVLIIA